MNPAGPGQELLAAARALAPELVAVRRELHRDPELSYQERGTQARLRRTLESAGFECRDVATTGLVARLPGTWGSGPSVALRADIDALPIAEAGEAEYRSRNTGVMHACGHDAHSAMVLGAGRLLLGAGAPSARRLVLLFQPAEEMPPGGARAVLAEGVLAAEKVEAIFGLHVDPRFPAGQILLRRGPLMAASDRFRVTIIGRGGHGGYPHLAVDPVVIAAQVVLAIQAIVSRRLEPTEPGVISIGRIEGGTADNIIPERVTLSGTIRSHSADVRRMLPEAIRTTAEGIAAAAGARAEFEHEPGHPGLANDPALVDWIAGVLAPRLGAERLVDLAKPIMGGEDFAHYLEVLPGAFLRLGVRNEARGIIHPIHSPQFDLDEEALPVGAAALAAVAQAWVERPASGS